MVPQDRAERGLTCGLLGWLQALHCPEVLGRFCFNGRSSLYCWEVLTLVYPNPPTLGKMSGRQLAEPAVVSITTIPTPWDPQPIAQQTWGHVLADQALRGSATAPWAQRGSAGLAAAHATPCTVPVPACSCETQLPPEGHSQYLLKHRTALLSPSSP